CRRLARYKESLECDEPRKAPRAKHRRAAEANCAPPYGAPVRQPAEPQAGIEPQAEVAPRSNIVLCVCCQDAVSALLQRTSSELEAVEQELALEENERASQLDMDGHQWLSMLGEDSPQLVLGLEEEEEGEEERKDSVKAEKRFAGSGPAYGGEEREEKCREEPAREEEEEKEEEERRCKERRPQANKGPTLVDAETNTEMCGVAVRPKDRPSLGPGPRSAQRGFVRNSMIMRSQTFSPGERNQYICRVSGLYTHSEHHNSLDSDLFFVILVLYSSTLSLKEYNDNEGEVQTVSFNLRVFSYILDEPIRNYSTFCTWSPHFKVLQVFVELAS
ncbi:unnamed protein product, partial [Oncorhynchus mykiss]